MEKSEQQPVLDYLDLLACPVCHGTLSLSEKKDILDCPACKLRFPVKAGIPNLIPGDAEQY
jgi:uncharacterized protein YbaR (Trm112 family)